MSYYLHQTYQALTYYYAGLNMKKQRVWSKNYKDAYPFSTRQEAFNYAMSSPEPGKITITDWIDKL